jgi:hypothetical protein
MSMAIPLIAVCSARPRPSVHKGSKGHQWWSREVYHLAGSDGMTLCGRATADWLTIGPVEQLDHDCCKRCRAAAEPARTGDSR